MKSPKDIAIKVDSLTKTFRIPLEASSGIKQRLINLLRGRKGYREFTPLNDISFEVEKGDFFGIVGRNGSGKSTLLKTMAGIYTTNGGSVQINGKLVPFIELGVGFNPELSGRENVYLNGALLGFSHAETDKMYADIVDFAELHDFMEERLKNYSSGMQVRLAFSIAIQAKGDILILDEVLAVGDAAFQQKCFDYFGDLKREKKTVVLVTHDMGAVEKYCNKAMLIEKGKIIKQGDNHEVADAYKQLFIEGAANKIQNSTGKTTEHKHDGLVDVSRLAVSQDGKTRATLKALKAFSIEMEFKSGEDIGPGAVGITIINSVGTIVMAMGTGSMYDKPYSIKKGLNKLRFTVDTNVLNQDTFSLNVAIARGEPHSNQALIYQKINAMKFNNFGIKSRNHGLIQSDVSLEEY